MSVVKKLMAVLRIARTLMVHILVAAALATILAAIDTPAMVLNKCLWLGLVVK